MIDIHLTNSEQTAKGLGFKLIQKKHLSINKVAKLYITIMITVLIAKLSLLLLLLLSPQTQLCMQHILMSETY